MIQISITLELQQIFLSGLKDKFCRLKAKLLQNLIVVEGRLTELRKLAFVAMVTTFQC